MNDGDQATSWQGGTQIDEIDHVNVIADVRKRHITIAQHTSDRLNTFAWWVDKARDDNPNRRWVVLRPTKTGFDLP